MKTGINIVQQDVEECGKGVWLSPLSPTPLGSPFIFTRGKGLLYQPTHLLRTKQKSCSIFLCSISFPIVGGEEIPGLCSRLTLPRLGIGTFKSETMAFCRQHCPLHQGTLFYLVSNPNLLHTHGLSNASYLNVSHKS